MSELLGMPHGAERNNQFQPLPKHLKINLTGQMLNNGKNTLNDGQIYIYVEYPAYV